MAIPIEFENPEFLQKWLQEKPHEFQSILATRTALRVFPLAFRLLETPDDRVVEIEPKLALREACRAAFISWCASRYIGTNISSLIAERAADVGITSAANAIVPSSGESSSDRPAQKSPAVSAAFALGAAMGVVAANPLVVRGRKNAAYFEATPASLAAAAAARAADAAEDFSAQVWEAVSADCRWLQEKPSVQALMVQPLWLIDVRGDPKFEANFPLWVREPFDAFDKSELVTKGPWGLWLAWYRAILPNDRSPTTPSRFGEKTDIAIATQENAFWSRDPDVVMAAIADMVGWEWSRPPEKMPAQPASPTTPEPPPPIVSVEPQSDEPTADDQLGRRPFAQALVERMDRLYEKGGHDGFAAHIHAPWGAGKTSVLLMMRDLMSVADRKSNDGKVAPRWAVVHFNAWEHERRNPPWWPLIETVKTECLACLSPAKVGWLRAGKACARRLWQVARPGPDPDHDHAALLQARWLWWKTKTDALPYLTAVIVGVICLWLLLSIRSAPQTGQAIFEGILKVFTAALAAYAAFSGASRVAVFGSTSGAKFYEDISQDPLKRITKLFKDIVNQTAMPICVFIDDLDRCRSDYVVDLLEGIQTSFRNRKVAYVVAADRSWIKASFEARYGGFSAAVGSVGQPLGYLFLEKIFQLSTPVPGMGDRTRTAYWNRLLKGASPGQAGQAAGDPGGGAPLRGVTKDEFDRVVESKRADLRQQHGEHLTREKADSILQQSDTAADLAAVVLELNASRAVEKEAEHLLARFTGIVPDNPRVMKRMVNAFAMRQAIGLLERSVTPTEVLARWTILEQRFPALADLLIEHPEWTKILAEEVGDKDKLPPLIQPFVGLQMIRDILTSGEGAALTEQHVRTITRGSAG